MKILILSIKYRKLMIFKIACDNKGLLLTSLSLKIEWTNSKKINKYLLFHLN